MKLFSRGSDAEKPPKGNAAATPAPTLISPPPPPAAPAAPPAPPAPDVTAVLDANVKEMSEKIARLASTLEQAQNERQGFESRIAQMDDRMRKLSSLTEMISAQYNPFVGDAPQERQSLPEPEVGLASPYDAQAAALVRPMPEAHTVDPHGFAAAAPAMPVEAATDLAARPAETPSNAPPEMEGVQVYDVRPCFETNMVMLAWADTLLRGVGSREHLHELVAYYANIGWIGDPARDKILGYADGIAAPATGGEGSDWRVDLDVHEKSLLFVEKLKAINAKRPDR